MPAIQTTYGATIPPAYEGMVANSTDHTIRSRQLETPGGIGFGKVAVQGTADFQIRVSEADSAFVGITEAEHFQTGEAYPRFATVPVMEYGDIWVVTSVAVAAGDAAYYVPATGVITKVATGNVAIPSGKFLTSGGIGALVLLHLG